ncbi:MAG: exodeoxyribonuclease VII large subunit [Eubacterium sp.]|nr:exodeoxyribonuclease VII large subunit [Eubacterium sp.]
MSSVYTVGQVNSYIKNMFRQDFLLTDISVSGEVSNCKFHRSGHVYFTLKDKDGSISCVMFAGMRQGLAFSMKDGDKVIVSGYIDVYEKTGVYQLYARRIRPDGAGALYEKFLRLKEELEEMGMFDASYKQPVPSFPKKVGVVTSPTGAAIRDIVSVLTRRNPGVQIILYPALVQGEGAKESIAFGLSVLDRAGCDVIIVGRGGGSIEDLWAFNEEIVARAVFDCVTPVISAVGHETDVTITDFVADLRAPTPSAAAELATIDVRELINRIEAGGQRLSAAMNRILNDRQRRLAVLKTRLAAASPKARLERQKEALGFLKDRLVRAKTVGLERKRNALAVLAGRLEGLSPVKKLSGGFSYVENERKQAVTATDQVSAGERLYIHVTDGMITAKAETIEKKETP